MGLLNWYLDKKREKEDRQFIENAAKWDVNERVAQYKEIMREKGYDEEYINREAAEFERKFRAMQAECTAYLNYPPEKREREIKAQVRAELNEKHKAEQEAKYQAEKRRRACSTCTYYYAHVCTNDSNRIRKWDGGSSVMSIENPSNTTCDYYRDKDRWL